MLNLKVKGKTIDSNEWVIGYYYFDGSKHWILSQHPTNKFCHADEVILETVEQINSTFQRR